MDRAQYEAHAEVEGSHWWFTGRRQILAAIVDALSGGHQARIADVGCGTGGNVAALAAAGHDVLGIDPSPDAIALARARFPGVRFIESSGPEPAREQLAGGGIALLTDVLEHVEHDRDLLGTVIDVIPGGGHAILTVPADPALWSPHDVAFGHHRRYRLREFAALWDGLPVEVRLLSHFNARLRPLIAAVRRVERGRAPRAGGDLRIPAGPMNGVLREIFAGERHRLLAHLDRATTAYDHGVSLIAVLRRR